MSLDGTAPNFEIVTTSGTSDGLTGCVRYFVTCRAAERRAGNATTGRSVRLAGALCHELSKLPATTYDW